MVLRAREVLSQYETWELIPQEAIIEDAKEKGRAAADKATQQDNTVLWALPLEPHEVRERFELTTALKSRAQKRKAEAMEPSSEGVMPDEIQGRITTAFLKNGMPLCSAFQMKSCPADGTTCTKLHKCAVVLRTGRACGGSHPACECRDKRAVKAEVESPSPKPTPAKAARLVGGRHPPGLPSAEQVVKKPAAKPRPRAAEPQSANPTATGSRAPVQEPCREDQEEHFDNLAGGGKRDDDLLPTNRAASSGWRASLDSRHFTSILPQLRCRLYALVRKWSKREAFACQERYS